MAVVDVGAGPLVKQAFLTFLCPFVPFLAHPHLCFFTCVCGALAMDALGTVVAAERDTRIMRKRRQECKCLQQKAECN